MHNTKIRLIVVLGIISIVGIISIQSYWLSITFKEKRQDFDNKVRHALENVAYAVVAYNNHELTVLHPVQQVSFNHYVVNVNDVIHPMVLEHYMKTEFKKENISLDYQYAVYDCDAQKMMHGRKVTQNNERVENVEVDLPLQDEYTYYFGVVFPNLNVFLIKSLRIWLVFAVLSILTLVFFGYAIFTILQQSRLSQLQKDFINNMTHEFKTPISSIRLASDFLLSNSIVMSHERLKKYAELLNEQNERLNKQVENILQLARAEKGNFKLEKKTVDLVQNLRSIIDLYMLKYNEQIKIDFTKNTDNLSIQADEFHLNNVIHNLIDNAVKYCKGNCHLAIDLEVNEQIKLRFADNGIGIPEKYRKKVFQKFYRIPTGNVHNVKGFGLGLYYVKTICEKHRWKIKLKSAEDQGTQITIFIKK